ncbi:MAG: hypothetical protein INR70_34790, partial [Parafilimonas terrae]|nr:hypothetical protein [Parafilimonas terrae]
EAVTVTEERPIPAAEMPNPVGAILDALPEQILAWYRTEERPVDPEDQAATDAVLDGLGESLLDQFRASRGLPAPLADAIGPDKAAKIAA